jgi:molybdopterin/thiamine biosynthesis adenylyltransferase/rhodanese-related sulfurtransferase
MPLPPASQDPQRPRTAEISPSEVHAKLRAGVPFLLLDVREQDEYAEGVLPSALLTGRSALAERLAEATRVGDTEIVLYCAAGVRSIYAAFELWELGYTNVKSMAGGFQGWRALGLPVEGASGLSQEQTTRYSRHLRMPEIGVVGQQKLLNAKILLVGAGGLGSPAALYLAAAGMGTLGIADDDIVDLSNLQRQILHRQDRIGQPKVDSAAQTLASVNPEVRVVRHPVRLDAGNALELLRDYDLVIDGSDNFPTRYLVNDACFALGKPHVHGSVFRFDGQVTVFAPGRGPCYRCLYPAPPPPDAAPSCAVAGVLGVLPGIIGTLQALEALKLVLGIGEPLIGRLLAFDALQMRFHELTVRPDPGCPLCGTHPTIQGLGPAGPSCRP